MEGPRFGGEKFRIDEVAMKGVPIPRSARSGLRREIARPKAPFEAMFVFRGIFPRDSHRTVRQQQRLVPGPDGQGRQFATLPVQPARSRHQQSRRFGCSRRRHGLRRWSKTNILNCLRFRRTRAGETDRRGPSGFDAGAVAIVI